MKKGETKPAVENEEPTMSLEIADENGEMMALPATFMVDQTDGIRMLTAAREWRAMTDKAAGYFDASGDNMGPKTKMKILNYRKEFAFFGNQYGEDEMEVIQVLFVDQDNVLSSMVLMKSAKEEFSKMIDNILLKQKPVVMFDVTAEMEKKRTKNGFDYHLVNFKAELMDTANFKEIVAFVKANPKSVNMFRDLPRK